MLIKSFMDEVTWNEVTMAMHVNLDDHLLW